MKIRVFRFTVELLLRKQLFQTKASMGQMRETGGKHGANCISSLKNCYHRGVVMSVTWCIWGKAQVALCAPIINSGCIKDDAIKVVWRQIMKT